VSEVLFGGSWVVFGIPQAGRDRAVEGECHDGQQMGETVGVVDLRVLDAEATRLKSENIGSITQRLA